MTQVLSKVLISSAFVFGLINCSKPVEEKLYEAETKGQEEQSEVGEAEEEHHEVTSDSVN